MDLIKCLGFACLTILELSYVAQADNKFLVHDNTTQLNLTDPLLTAQGGTLSDPLGALSSLDFSRNHFSASQLFSTQTWWHQIPIQAQFQSEASQTWVLNIENHMINRLEISVIRNGQLRTEDIFLLGDEQLLRSQLPFRGTQASFEIFPNESVVLLIGKRSDGPLITPMSLTRKSQFDHNLALRHLVWTAAMATLCALAIYNGLIYAFYHLSVYGWYIVYQMVAATYFAVLLGFGYNLWSLEFQQWLLNHVITLNVLLSWSIFRFSLGFLQASTHVRFLRAWQPPIEWSMAAVLLASLMLPEYVSAFLFFGLQVVLTGLCIFAAIVALRNGYQPALLYLASWVFVLIGGAIGTLIHWSVLPFNQYTQHALLAGVLLEIFALSLALAYRTRFQARQNLESALLDPDTRLPNRTFIRTHLNQALLQQKPEPFHLVLIELVGVQEMLKVLGPDKSDQAFNKLIINFHRQLQFIDWVRPVPSFEKQHAKLMVAGPDRIALLMDDTKNLNSQMTTLLAFTRVPINFSGIEISPRALAGLATYPDQGVSVDELYRKAQIAAQQCQIGIQPWVCYDDKSDNFTQERFKLMADLRHAVQDLDFEFQIQPKVNLATGMILGGEILIRWRNHPKYWKHPGDFIPIAEQIGLIPDITAFMLKSAFIWIAEHRVALGQQKLSINVSALDLDDFWLADGIENLIKTFRVPPQQLVIELTESALIRDRKKSIRVIKAIQSKGVEISIDDFGTGYSSMSHLSSIQPDEIKIDQSFVQDLEHKPVNQHIVVNIINLANSLNARCIAEGIETLESVDFLLASGCEVGQGYHWSKAVGPGEFLQLIKTQPFLNSASLAKA